MSSRSGISVLLGDMLGWTITRSIGAIALACDLYERSRLPYASDLALSPWDEGPDDEWPAEEFVGPSRRVSEPSEPERITTVQWGLRLPSGEVAWNFWGGVSFLNPLDRMLMVAKLQKTGLDMGFAEDQVGEFLGHYAWVTRNQFATMVYEDTGFYSLTDPGVSIQAPVVEVEKNDSESQIDPEDRGDAAPALSHPDPRVCRRSMGSDAH